jgi:hypothetical protein
MYDFKVKIGLDPIPLVAWLQAVPGRGEELLATGVPALQAGSATRERVLAAYERAGRVPTAAWQPSPTGFVTATLSAR